MEKRVNVYASTAPNCAAIGKADRLFSLVLSQSFRRIKVSLPQVANLLDYLVLFIKCKTKKKNYSTAYNENLKRDFQGA